MLLEETPELAAQDPQAPAADGTAQNDTAAQHTPEGSVLLTPEQIQQALDSGALEDAEAQCIDLTDENGFFRWLFNWLFGSKDKEEEPAPVYSGWRTENGKTYYCTFRTYRPGETCLTCRVTRTDGSTAYQYCDITVVEPTEEQQTDDSALASPAETAPESPDAATTDTLPQTDTLS